MEGSLSWVRPRKCPAGLRGRATRMAVQARRDPDGPKGAVKRVADEPGVHPEALRARVRRAEIDAGERAGTTTADAPGASGPWRPGTAGWGGPTRSCARRARLPARAEPGRR